MDEFKLDDDLISDPGYRRHSRLRRSLNGPAVISRQYLMIGTGILVLLLLVIGVGSALKAPTKHEVAQRNPTVAERNIDFSDLSLPNNNNNPQTDLIDKTNNTRTIQNSAPPQMLNTPLIHQAPAETRHQAVTQGQLRSVELPGSIASALPQQQEQMDLVSQEMIDMQVTPLLKKSGHHVDEHSVLKPEVIHKDGEQLKSTIVASKSIIETNNKSALEASSDYLQNMPSSHFTLQLSSASRSDTLQAFAKQKKLINYQVYETQRDGKPWFVLVSGNYASSAEAKKAISALPFDIQEKKPWVKSVHQIQKNMKK